MRGLTIVVVGADGERFAAALALASANAALASRTRLYCHDAAVTQLERNHAIQTALDLDVTFIACQSGLAAHGLALPDFAHGGGLVSLLADLGDDRLVTV